MVPWDNAALDCGQDLDAEQVTKDFSLKREGEKKRKEKKRKEKKRKEKKRKEKKRKEKKRKEKKRKEKKRKEKKRKEKKRKEKKRKEKRKRKENRTNQQEIHIPQQQVANPRLFKSHCTYEKIVKGGKYIYVARNPKAVLMSFYQFLLPYFQVSLEDVPFKDFVIDFYLRHGSLSGSIYKHFLGWWNVRESKDVLWVFFEDLKEDLPKCVEKIAEFMEIELDDELKKIVCEVSSYEYMREHAHQFDDHFVRKMVLKRIGLPIEENFSVGKGFFFVFAHFIFIKYFFMFPFFFSSFFSLVRAGGGKVKYDIGDEVEAILQRCWEEEMTPVTGHKTYEEFRNDLSFLKK